MLAYDLRAKNLAFNNAAAYDIIVVNENFGQVWVTRKGTFITYLDKPNEVERVRNLEEAKRSISTNIWNRAHERKI